jgi:hypothetical protein
MSPGPWRLTLSVSKPFVRGEGSVWGRTDGAAMTNSPHITRTGLGRVAAALAALALALAASPVVADATHNPAPTAGAECCGP